jgi:hypothetical protein
VDHLYIDPAQILTVRQVGGTTIEISDDVQGVARSLREIDDRFRLRADLDHVQNLLGWTVELHIPLPDGSTEEHFVCAYRELDHRIVRDARRYTSPGYNIADELEKEDAAQATRRWTTAAREQSGEIGERLAHAIRAHRPQREAELLMPQSYLDLVNSALSDDFDPASTARGPPGDPRRGR